MFIKKEVELRYFEAWGPAITTMRKLSLEELDELEEIISDDFCDKTETELNDFLAYDDEVICSILGISEEEWEAR